MIETIISNNCAGAAIMHDLGMEFKTPTVNLQILPEQFPKFCKHLEYYMNQELYEVTSCLYDLTETQAEYINTMFGVYPTFPIGLLNDILVLFQHYDTFEEAKAKWDERRERVDYKNIGYIFHARGPEYKESAAKFLALPLQNKLCLTQNFALPGSISFEGEAFSNYRGKLLITQVYDFKKWMTQL